MSILIPVDNGQGAVDVQLEQAIDLLSQQIWCWGRDILRPEGNFLLEIGFERIEPPEEFENCSSVYIAALPNRRLVVLRGFGVFYGDYRCGGVYLPRYEFCPRYTVQTKLECPPWYEQDLPQLSIPMEDQRSVCAALTLELLDWIRGYEATVAKRLGVEYRRGTLLKWNNGKRRCFTAEQMSSAWRALSQRVAADFGSFLTND